MAIKDILLVTFPLDLGNRTIESNLRAIFHKEMDLFRFAVQHANNLDSGRVSLTKSILYRIQSARELRQIVRRYTKEGKTIVFNGLSPALFSYGVWKTEKTVIALDWTRTLQQTTYGDVVQKDKFFRLHRFILQRCPRILYCTTTLRRNLSDVYDVDESQMFQVPIPFLIENLDIAPRPTPLIPRVLFVGGDLKRKGGDLLLNAWQNSLSSRCHLTMMTSDEAANIQGVRVLKGISYGSPQHKKTFEDHDILILPTRFDSYPQVIGEAIAAGLAVVTTRFALAAEETIIHKKTGFIGESVEESLILLEGLLSNISLIDEFKREGYKLIKEKYSKTSIHDQYMEVINKKIL